MKRYYGGLDTKNKKEGKCWFGIEWDGMGIEGTAAERK